MLDRFPQPEPAKRPPKMFKRLIDLRGPELIHNKLIYKMYGIRVCSPTSFNIICFFLLFKLI